MECPSFLFMALTAVLGLLSSRATGADLPRVTLSGEVGNAADASAARFRFAPFDSLPWLRTDLTGEKVSEFDDNFHSVMRRPYKQYSGDISGRFIEIMALSSFGNLTVHPALKGLLEDVLRHQREGGYFCASGTIDWQTALDAKDKDGPAANRMLPALWGNSRMLCGLIEATRAFPGDKALARAALDLGDFYLSVLPRFTDPARIDEYNRSGTYAAGYVTCWFPAMEGLVRLAKLTGANRYLDAAKTIAAFHERFDRIPIDHAHGMLCCHVALLELYEATGDASFLERVERRWEELVRGGYINPAGGILEKCRVHYTQRLCDEGCAIADWLRLNLALGRVTGEARYWAMAERTLHNHFLQNQTATGGFGHRYVLADSKGVYGFQKRNNESTWCCTFHGELGFIELRRHVLKREGGVLTCRFPLEFTATDSSGTTTSLFQLPWRSSHVIRQRISLAGQPATRVRVRHPHWADEVIARSGWGQALEVESKDGWHTTREPVTEVLFIYTGGPYAEDRFCNRLPDGPRAGRPFVIGHGPRLLAAESDSIDTPDWPTTLETLDAQGLKPLSRASRQRPSCFVMGRAQ